MDLKYTKLLKDNNVRRWHENVSRGSAITANVYLKRLGHFCEMHDSSPAKLCKLTDKQTYNLLLDSVADLEKRNLAGSYIASIMKAIKSWLLFNGKVLTRRIQIRGSQDTPTLKNEKVPTQLELGGIFLAGDDKGRTTCALVAHSGLRPQVLGDYGGDDGLTIGDLPELIIEGHSVQFKTIPTMVRVRSKLSKKRNDYFSFLSAEGCEYLRSYLEARLRSGEKLNNESAVITPKFADNKFITTVNISDIIRTCMKTAGFKLRPYVLRSYFDTQLMIAEAKGMMIRDYRTFFMGHKGDIEHTYTLNKTRLPDEVVEQMRECYGKAQQYLQTREVGKSRDDMTRLVKKQLLLLAGVRSEEITDKLFEMNDDEFNRILREKFTTEIANNGVKQKVVPLGDVESYLKTGWEYVSTLPGDRAVVKLPESC